MTIARGVSVPEGVRFVGIDVGKFTSVVAAHGQPAEKIPSPAPVRIALPRSGSSRSSAKAASISWLNARSVALILSFDKVISSTRPRRTRSTCLIGPSGKGRDDMLAEQLQRAFLFG